MTVGRSLQRPKVEVDGGRMLQGPKEVEVDGGRMLREATELAFPRYSGTNGDEKAIAWVARQLTATGLAVSRQTFSYDLRPALRALRALILLAVGALVGAGWLAPRAPAAAAGLLLLPLLPAAFFLAWSPLLEAIYRRSGSQRTENLWGHRPADGTPRRTLILLAHHDSKSQNLTMLGRGALTALALAGVFALAAYCVLTMAIGRPPGAPAWPLAGGLTGAAALLVLSTLKSGNRSPGGVDNAGSVAVLLELARRLPAVIPADVELIFLSPGAEEDHMVGAMRWLDVQLPALAGRPVAALNFDGAGAPGRLVLLERFGLGKLFSPTLSRLARQAAGELGYRLRGVLLPPAMGIDAIPFAHRGVECLTVSSGALDRATLAVHSRRDVAGNLDRATLERAARLGLEVARRWAQS